MENQILPKDFKEFLRLLNAHRVEYLLIGGYAVGCHGYPLPPAGVPCTPNVTIFMPFVADTFNLKPPASVLISTG